MADRLKVTDLDRIKLSFGLLRASVESASAEFLEWTNGILNPAGIRMQGRPLDGSFLSTIEMLLPCVMPPTKSLFVACKDGWTAMFENGVFGTDAGRLGVLAKRMKTTTMRVVAIPEVKNSQYGATIWELYDHAGTRRSLYAMNDGGRWDFGSQGEPFAFEETGRYSVPRIRDRFSNSMLRAYLKEFDASPFCDEWFEPAHSVLVERVGGYLQEAPSSRTSH